MFTNKLKLIALLAFVVILYVILNKVIIPLTYDAAKSELYLDGSDDNASLYPVSSAMSDMAYKHCNTYIEKELDDDVAPIFQPQPINAWDIGSYTFVINGEVELRDKEGVTSRKKYVCRIKFEEGDQNDFNNWSIYGVSGLDDI
jgi:hypothetical protein